MSTSATEIQGNEPLGTLAGKGYNSNKKGGTITINVSGKEFGFDGFFNSYGFNDGSFVDV